jgi:hypothetical protein
MKMKLFSRTISIRRYYAVLLALIPLNATAAATLESITAQRLPHHHVILEPIPSVASAGVFPLYQRHCEICPGISSGCATRHPYQIYIVIASLALYYSVSDFATCPAFERNRDIILQNVGELDLEGFPVGPFNFAFSRDSSAAAGMLARYRNFHALANIFSCSSS